MSQVKEVVVTGASAYYSTFSSQMKSPNLQHSPDHLDHTCRNIVYFWLVHASCWTCWFNNSSMNTLYRSLFVPLSDAASQLLINSGTTICVLGHINLPFPSLCDPLGRGTSCACPSCTSAINVVEVIGENNQVDEPVSAAINEAPAYLRNSNQ